MTHRKIYRNALLMGLYLLLAGLAGYFLSPVLSERAVISFGILALGSFFAFPIAAAEGVQLSFMLALLGGGPLAAGFRFATQPGDPTNILLALSAVGIVILLVGYVLHAKQTLRRYGADQ